jgi:hypothetical protein
MPRKVQGLAGLYKRLAIPQNREIVATKIIPETVAYLQPLRNNPVPPI